MSLSQAQKDAAKVTLFKQAKFTFNDVVNTLLRQGVATDAVRAEAVDLVYEWLTDQAIRELETNLYQRIR